MSTKSTAYADMIRSGAAATQAVRVLNVLSQSKLPLLRQEIADRLGIKESSVCGRLAELRESGQVVEDGERINPFSGVACTTYRPARKGDEHIEGQGDLFRQEEAA